MAQDKIVVVGARENNLKNITVEIPRDRLVVITGLSGSGKSSLAFDTIYAEGQRRYVESLSAYARQFLGQMDKPDVDHIEGLSPAVSIDQKGASRNPRSTVGTVTEIYDYLRILFARAGIPHCINGHGPIHRQSTDQIVDAVLGLPEGTRIQVLSPLVRGRKGEFKSVIEETQRAGYVRVRVDGLMYEVTDDIPMDRYKQHTIEVVVDRIVKKEGLERRLADSVESALKMGKGVVNISTQTPGSEGEDWSDMLFSESFSCAECGYSLPELEPRLFSFNSPYGACAECAGLGTQTEFDINLIIPDRRLPLRGGAILPFVYKSGETKEWWPDVLQALGEQVGFDADRPVSELSPEHLHIVMNGTDTPVSVRVKYGSTERKINTKWAGVAKILRKKYDETTSDWVKRDLDQYMSTHACPDCKGQRLKSESLNVTLDGRNIADVTSMSVGQAMAFFEDIPARLSTRQMAIGERAVKEISERLRFLVDVGLAYLSLDRNARTLAGGEAQRIRLATQIGSGLMGCLYVLDEPSIGLHQRDNRKLIQTLQRLRDIGNTVIVVEHDEETMLDADWLIDLGPGAGEHGGEVINEGLIQDFLKKDVGTAQWLTGKKKIAVPPERRAPRSSFAPNNPDWIALENARGHNLNGVQVQIPKGVFTCITGVSGSGKSTLIQDTLFPRLMFEVYGTRGSWEPHDALTGAEGIDKVIDIDQSAIGRTPRSNPATYTGTFDMIRDLMTLTPDAKLRGYKPGRFSFNVKGGRCEACKGDGIIKIEMVFLPDVYVPCDVCKGKRYNRETLEVKYKGKSISDILNMTIEEACEFFKPIPKIYRKLSTLLEVGLGYVRMGQSATTLSGGEAQRMKLAAELSKRDTGSTVYILDEPTTGLHFADVDRLLGVLHTLVDRGNTVIVIEHNLDVIKTADWIVDMGPEGGDGGGTVLVQGPPEQVAATPGSHTGRYLKDKLA